MALSLQYFREGFLCVCESCPSKKALRAVCWSICLSRDVARGWEECRRAARSQPTGHQAPLLLTKFVL